MSMFLLKMEFSLKQVKKITKPVKMSNNKKIVLAQF